MMLGSMSLQFGMALTGMAICLPFQIAVSLSIGESIISCLQHFSDLITVSHCKLKSLTPIAGCMFVQGLALIGSWTIGLGRPLGYSQGLCASRWQPSLAHWPMLSA